MARTHKNNHLFRGLLQSEDGVISRVLDVNSQSMTFETTFGLSEELIDQLKNQPEHIVFSERSRIARLGMQIKCDPPTADSIKGSKITLTLVASAVIAGYPGLEEMAGKFNVPDRIYPPFTAIGLLLGPTCVLLASVVASLYPMLKLYVLEPVAAMRAA